MITGVNHIGIAVESLSEIKETYTELLKGNPIHEETVAEQKSKILSFALGETHLEFLEPTDPESPIAKFLEKKGKGVHHISLTTDNIEKDIELLTAKGFNFIDKTPRQGMGGTKIAFIHPKSTSPMLVELTQNPIG